MCDGAMMCNFLFKAPALSSQMVTDIISRCVVLKGPLWICKEPNALLPMLARHPTRLLSLNTLDALLPPSLDQSPDLALYGKKVVISTVHLLCIATAREGFFHIGKLLLRIVAACGTKAILQRIDWGNGHLQSPMSMLVNMPLPTTSRGYVRDRQQCLATLSRSLVERATTRQAVSLYLYAKILHRGVLLLLSPRCLVESRFEPLPREIIFTIVNMIGALYLPTTSSPCLHLFLTALEVSISPT